MKSVCLALGCSTGLLLGADSYTLGPESLERLPDVPRGRVEMFQLGQSAIFPDTTRAGWVYLPAQLDTARPAALMVFQDGHAYVRENGDFRVPVVLDNLIGRGELPPIVGVFLNPGHRGAGAPPDNGWGNRNNRSFEYDSLGDAYARFLVEEVLPFVTNRYGLRLSTDPRQRAICGMSSGGICAWTVAWERPDQFGKVLSQIGSFVNIRGGHVYPALIRKTERKPIRVFLQDGSNDLNNLHGNWPLANQELASALAFSGYDFRFVFGDGAHNGKHGGAIFPDSVRWLFRPELDSLPKPLTQDNLAGDEALSKLLPDGGQPGDWTLVGEGYAFTDAACADAAGNFYFSDLPKGTIYRVGLDGSKPVAWLENGPRISGMKFGPDGRLYACVQGQGTNNTKRIVAITPETRALDVVATDVNPNDLVVSRAGWIYFTDTEAGAVVRVPIGARGMSRPPPVASGIRGPNGIGLAPDERSLVVSEYRGTNAWTFLVAEDGTLRGGERNLELRAPLNRSESGGDGLALDPQGRAWITSHLGIQVFDANGRLGGVISRPQEKGTVSCGFGGPDRSWLYVCSSDRVYRRKTLRDQETGTSPEAPRRTVTALDPPEQDFFAKRLDYDGIPIKAPAVVVDEALFAAYDRLSMMLTNLPTVRAKLREAGAALHIIGRDQVTTDLPEWRQDKGKPLAEYNGLTRDQRTRGMGGLLTSCGEENLLRLENDRYRGRDICVHEFAHNILSHGVPRAIREKVRAQHRRSLDRGLWVGSYAGSNYHEFFAELAMWYFGTHGDLTMQGEKPSNGREGLQAYDPEAFRLLDDFFNGRIELATDEAVPAVKTGSTPPGNLALIAKASTSYVSGHETITALNDGSDPAHSDDKRRGAYGNWPRTGTQWVQYDWSQPVKTGRIEVYWFDDQRGVRLPTACRLQFWDGTRFVPVANTEGLGLAANQFNITTFPEIRTTRLRLEFEGRDTFSTGLLEWRVLDSGGSPNFAPVVEAGVDRFVVLNGQTHLEGRVRDDGKPSPTSAVQSSKQSGPGAVAFTEAHALATDARFSQPGAYTLKLTANDGELSSTSTLQVTVTPPPPPTPLTTVPTRAYTLTSRFWSPRAKALIVNWIPHCIRKIEDPQTAEGGIGTFVEAGRKLAGATDARHVGAVFANTWVYNTLESICVALQVDPQGDRELAAAQAAMRRTLKDWIPKILSAQEPDGYLHTMYTIQGHRRWQNKHDHEDYQAGYFLEAAIAHWWLTGGRDTRLYDAAKRLADCWVRHLGPAPKQAWYPGHQEMEMALVRFADLVEQVEGPGHGAAYVALAKFLLDQRREGEEYDQSHLPVTRQYEAVGHAVRAAYSYAGMADVAMATGDVDYHSAIQSLWNSIVNRKYYVTGGIGSGETSEGFGQEYSLPNRAYCESCAGTGELLFQHKLNRAYQAARYADLYEETLYNAILGGVDLEGQNYTYTNPLDSGERRYKWHVCPCCVGNLPRTLLSLPTWMYAKSADSLYVNLFIASKVQVGDVEGTPVEVVQETDYPWRSQVKLTLNPAAPRRFAVRIRVPDRRTSELYAPSPATGGLVSLSVNGEATQPIIESGYVGIAREWTAGDRIEFELPLEVQRITASDRIAATRGRVALRYGPLIYNLESVDQDLEGVLRADTTLGTAWRADLLGGVLVIQGTFADGRPLLAVPNYARLNRGGRSIVWIAQGATNDGVAEPGP